MTSELVSAFSADLCVSQKEGIFVSSPQVTRSLHTFIQWVIYSCHEHPLNSSGCPAQGLDKGRVRTSSYPAGGKQGCGCGVAQSVEGQQVQRQEGAQHKAAWKGSQGTANLDERIPKISWSDGDPEPFIGQLDRR